MNKMADQPASQPGNGAGPDVPVREPISRSAGEENTFRQLKSLLVGEERDEIDALRSKLDRLDADSIERLSKDLAAALRMREEHGEEAFAELVAAMQGGTISAIQRSVSNDKQPLTKALFPIMGPAIRNYVLDLFRGMVEDLNRTIQHATSAERLRWRLQAKMAGKPYSEYVLLKTQSFRIEEAYLMQRDTGLLLLHVATNPANEASGEADLVSGMFTAIRSFVRDSFAKNEEGSEDDDDGKELDRFTFGAREVLIEVGPSLVLAAVVHGVPSPSVRDELKGILEDLHGELQPVLENFSGDTVLVEPARPALRKALIEHITEESKEKKSNLWRAWLVLGGLALAIATWIFISSREQNHWNRFEDALRAEPGVAVTSVEKSGWWKKVREVRGVRDPMAAKPSDLAKAHGIKLDRTTFNFDLVQSLEDPFQSARMAETEKDRESLVTLLTQLRGDLATLREEQEKSESEANRRTGSLVRSLLSDIPGLEVDFSNNSVTARGSVSEDLYDLAHSRLNPLKDVLAIDSSELFSNSDERLAAILTTISGTPVLYIDGTLEREDDGRVGELVAHLKSLVETARKAGKSYELTIVAHPLIGTNREENREIENLRIDQVRELLAAGGLDVATLKSRLSEDMTRAGNGVTIEAKEQSATDD